MLERTAGHNDRSSSALLVGDPAFDHELFPKLADLPEASREAASLAGFYPRATTLIAAAATREAVIASLPSAEIVDIASHALNGVEGGDAALVLAPSRNDSGLLTAREIAALALPRVRLVMLAGCRTAESAADRSVNGLSAAFMIAGARNVVGTLFKVDDAVARRFSEAFHQEIRKGAGSAVALRRVQMSMIVSADAERHALRSWSSFVLAGDGS
jgi:CHAT domain-containing protein